MTYLRINPTRELAIGEEVNNRGTIMVDIIVPRTAPSGFTSICTDLDEGGATAIVAALVAAFPAARPAPKRSGLPWLSFMGLDLDSKVLITIKGNTEDGYTVTAVEPAPQPEPKIVPGAWVHGPEHDVEGPVAERCIAARASVRLYGENGHPVSRSQVEKQRRLDALSK